MDASCECLDVSLFEVIHSQGGESELAVQFVFDRTRELASTERPSSLGIRIEIEDKRGEVHVFTENCVLVNTVRRADDRALQDQPDA